MFARAKMRWKVLGTSAGSHGNFNKVDRKDDDQSRGAFAVHNTTTCIGEMLQSAVIPAPRGYVHAFCAMVMRSFVFGFFES